MALPDKFTFPQLNTCPLTWGPVIDALTADLDPPTYISDAVVTASVYHERDPKNAATKPGTAMTTCHNLSLPPVGGEDGVYRVTVDTTAWPLGSNYTLVVDLTHPSGIKNHWEKRAEVVVRSDQ